MSDQPIIIKPPAPVPSTVARPFGGEALDRHARRRRLAIARNDRDIRYNRLTLNLIARLGPEIIDPEHKHDIVAEGEAVVTGLYEKREAIRRKPAPIRLTDIFFDLRRRLRRFLRAYSARGDPPGDSHEIGLDARLLSRSGGRFRGEPRGFKLSQGSFFTGTRPALSPTTSAAGNPKNFGNGESRPDLARRRLLVLLADDYFDREIAWLEERSPDDCTEIWRDAARSRR